MTPQTADLIASLQRAIRDLGIDLTAQSQPLGEEAGPVAFASVPPVEAIDRTAHPNCSAEKKGRQAGEPDGLVKTGR